MSKTTSLSPGRLLFKFCEVMFNLLLKEMASWFSLATHKLVPDPNSVIAAGKHPVGGRVVTPILRTPRRYRLCCHRNLIHVRKCTLFKITKFLSVLGFCCKKKYKLDSFVYILHYILYVQKHPIYESISLLFGLFESIVHLVLYIYLCYGSGKIRNKLIFSANKSRHMQICKSSR